MSTALTTDAELLRGDPRFGSLWLIDLVSHWGQWRHPREVAPNALIDDLCTMARDARVKYERWGYVIESGPDGYRVVDYHEPAMVFRIKPGRRPHVDTSAVLPGQMRLGEPSSWPDAAWVGSVGV